MHQFFTYAGDAFKEFGYLDIFEIILLSASIYYTALYIKRQNANWYNRFLFVFITAGFVLGVTQLNIARTVFWNMTTIIIIATVVIFAQDIKRGVWKLSRQGQKLSEAPRGKDFSADDLQRAAADVVRATQNLAKKNVGAIMIFSRTQLSPQIIESGIRIDAMITSQLIETLFFKNSPLHDGAVIFGNNMLIAAGCFLPLSLELNIPKELGTRHRAAIGITELMADAIALVVSEETGIISLTYQGKIYRYLDTEQLTVSVEAGLGIRELSDLKTLRTEKEEE